MSLEQLLSRAHALISQSRFSDAQELLISDAPHHAEAAMLCGVAANKNGNLNAAVAHFEIAERLAPGLATAPLNLGLTLRALNKTEAASLALSRALQLDPRVATGNFALGNIRMEQGHLDEAIRHFEAVIREIPDHVGALNNLGICCLKYKQPAQAENFFERAIIIDPHNAGALVNLGILKAEQGFTDEALVLYERAIQAEPHQVEAANNLGVALLDKGRSGEAVAVLRRLIDKGIAVFETYSNLGNALYKIGDTIGAAVAYETALSLKADDDGTRVKKALLLPVVATSKKSMEVARCELTIRIENLVSSILDLQDPFEEVGVPTFNLSYQDENNRAIIENLKLMYLGACPSLSYRASHCKEDKEDSRRIGSRVRIGFISRYFQSNSVGRCFHGVLRFHKRDDVSIIAFTFTQREDPLWASIAQDVEKTIILPKNLEAARRAIEEERLDVLVFTDIGMDPLTYFLAFARLAPFQYVLGGHPDSVDTGNIDAYISCDLQEPEDAVTHYSIPLIRLPGAPTYYEQPEMPSPVKPREFFNLPSDGALYFCGQTLVKIHPNMDELFLGILSRDITGTLVFLEGYTPELAEILKYRLRQNLGENFSRVRFLPAMSHMDYMNVMTLADVSLDTRPFGGGNTSWQAITAGTPMVTWPGEYLRGRYTQALYRLLNVTDAVAGSAEQYIELAVKFGTDSAFSENFNRRVAEAAPFIFADRVHVDALYEFLVGRIRSGT
jgi:protein O-GlcNAc transferase